MTASSHPFAGLRAHVVNLQRRPDRLKTFFADNGQALGTLRVEPFTAIDGAQLRSTYQTMRLFLTGFMFRAGEIGCALSHVLLWSAFARETGHDRNRALLIFEDDPLLCDGFAQQLENLWAQLADDDTWDVCFLSTLDKGCTRRPTQVGAAGSKLERWTTAHREAYHGGCHCYMLSRRGAERLLRLLDSEGLKKPIDMVIADSFLTMDILSAVPALGTADCLWHEKSEIDTDIQRTPRMGLNVAPPTGDFLLPNLAEVIAASHDLDAPTLADLVAAKKPLPPPKEWPPIELPTTLEQAQHMHRALRERAVLSESEARVERIYRANLDIPLSEGQRLFFLRARLKLAHRKQFGPLSAEDQALYDALDSQLDAKREQNVAELVGRRR